MEVTGRIKEVKQTQVISEKFQKREFVVTTPEEYPQHIQLEVINDKCALLDNLNVGDNVKCSINIRGREWTNPEGVVKYFNTLQAWRIEQVGGSFEPNLNTKTDGIPRQVLEDEIGSDDLPF